MRIETVRFSGKEIAVVRKLARVVPARQWEDWESDAPGVDDARRFGELRANAALHLERDRETVDAVFRVCDGWSDWDGEMSSHGFTPAEIDTLLGLHNALERLLEATG